MTRWLLVLLLLAAGCSAARQPPAQVPQPAPEPAPEPMKKSGWTCDACEEGTPCLIYESGHIALCCGHYFYAWRKEPPTRGEWPAVCVGK